MHASLVLLLINSFVYSLIIFINLPNLMLTPKYIIFITIYRRISLKPILLLQTHVICGNLICFLSAVNHIYFQSHRGRDLEWTPFFHHIYLHGHKPNETSSIIFISYPFYHLSGEKKFVFFIFQAFLNTHNFHAI